MISVRKFRVVAFGLLLIAVLVSLVHVLTDLPGGGSGPGATDASPEAGRAIFWGKGTCYTCHMVGGEGSAVRCPNLGVGDTDDDADPIAIRAASRVPGQSSRDYLIESLVYPEKHIIPGYGNLMPRPWRPPISLGADEMVAVIAYLQSLGGEVDVTVEDLPPEVLAAEGEPPVPFSPPPGIDADPIRGDEAFHDPAGKAGCARCHLAKVDGGHELVVDPGKGLVLDGEPVASDALEQAFVVLRSGMEQDLPLISFLETRGTVSAEDVQDVEKVLEEAHLEIVRGPAVEERAFRLVLAEGLEAPTLTLNDEDVAGPDALREQLAILRPEVAKETRFRIYHEDLGGMDGASLERLKRLCASLKLELTPIRRVGPDLTGIAARQPWEYLLQSILEPSVAIAREFEQVLIEDTDGRRRVGVVTPGETEDEIVLVSTDSAGNPEEIVLRTDEIASQSPQRISLMPGNYGELLEITEIYDLLTFLMRLK